VAAATVDAGRQTSLFSIRDDEPKNELTSRVLARALEESDELAEQLFDMAIETLGIGSASVVNIVDVELVVIGGDSRRARSGSGRPDRGSCRAVDLAPESRTDLGVGRPRKRFGRGRCGVARSRRVMSVTAFPRCTRSHL